MIRSIEWLGESVRFLDQSLLPGEERYIETSGMTAVAEAIVSLKLRGAPLIGIAASYGVLLGVLPAREASLETFLESLHNAVDTLAKTRPTATNLFWALERMQNVVRLNSTNKPSLLFTALEEEAKAIHDEDRRMCDSMAFYGEQLIDDGATILTHCNTGALATGGIGTALGVITLAHRNGKKISVLVDETRPLLQGARLTMWELQKGKIPATLITDNTAAWAIQKKNVSAIFVGADRIVANGDTANKIGTYGLAILAKEFGIPFYVVAPTSTVDRTLKNGSQIPIEERNPEEITKMFGSGIAPEGSNVFAPAFDVTPNELITAIVTERGIHRSPYGSSLAEAVRQ
ncbi:MAG: S-methyl-5-thioribose-1-phosphate isomerase [Bacteroidota bacterium]